jgi:glycine/D-amino acid oxidase-like deaminating enzyme
MPNLYQETAEPALAAAPFSGDASTHVAVVGAGFTGLSTALHLAERGIHLAATAARSIPGSKRIPMWWKAASAPRWVRA